jgi:endonuclease V-like protein UPF0215 family
MKKQVRVIGIDDSPFSFGSKTALVVGVVSRLPTYIEGIMRTEVRVDGNDADQAIQDMLLRSRYLEQLRLIMFDGVAVGGFNVIDIDRIFDATGVPCATLTRELPDYESMERALRTYFPDWKERWEVIRRHRLYKIGTRHKPVFATVVGMDLDILESIIVESTVQGAIPEPLRIAHLISSAMVLGESHGRA